ncbi:MAG: hypothetical protein J6M47_04615 [Clostridia bacterium]|nr:hypothetical protein [Clostridia bacterium]
MKDQLQKLLSRSPVPVPGVMAMLDASRSSRLVIAGDENASVLTLMEGVGLGCPELAGVQQPCVVEITRGENTQIMLGSVRCSSVSDMALRLAWPENRGAAVQITCPHDLYGREKLVFAVLDAQDFMTQLRGCAAGATGAVIVLDGFNAPSRAVYEYGKWLAQVGMLQQATAVLVHGRGDGLNTAPAMLLAVQMGVTALPTVECNTLRMTAREALDKAVAAMSGAGGDEALCRNAAQLAQQMLEAERARLTSAAPAARPRRSLADCFEAEIPGARQEMEKLITSAMANQIYGEMREFGIFLQKEIEGTFVASVDEIDKPKEAMGAFAQGWLDDTLSGFCSQLMNALATDTLMPKAQEIYDRIFEHAWIVQQDVREEEIDGQEMLRMQSTMGQLRQMGHSLLAGAIAFVIAYISPATILNLRNLSAFSHQLASEIQELVTPSRVYAKTKAKQLEHQLEKIISQYQDILTDTMLPQLRDELLGWFDAQTQAAMDSLRQADAQALKDYEQAQARRAEDGGRAEEIARFMTELAPYLA